MNEEKGEKSVQRIKPIVGYIGTAQSRIIFTGNFVQRMLYKDLYWLTIFYMYVLYSTFLYCVSRVKLHFVNSK